jgi:hypothetical protein
VEQHDAESNIRYHDDPMDGYGQIRQIRPKWFTSVSLILLALLGTTLASNINLISGESAEFGQGFIRSIACDSQIVVKLSSKFETALRASTDGFAPEVSVSDVANSCVGKRLILNLYGETSNVPLNLYPVIIDFTSKSGGTFTGLSTLTSPYFPLQQIDSSTNGSGNLGSSSEFGKSSFTALPFWGADGEQPEARDVRLVTVESTEIPEDSTSNDFVTFSANVVNTYQNRAILIKVPMNLNLVDFSSIPSNVSHELGPSSSLNGYTFGFQPIVLALPINTGQSVTETAYTFTESGISCAFITRETLVARYRCTTSNSTWSLGITF